MQGLYLDGGEGSVALLVQGHTRIHVLAKSSHVDLTQHCVLVQGNALLVCNRPACAYNPKSEHNEKFPAKTCHFTPLNSLHRK
jgi:hypothetical protein